jgi:hypothetical protein
MRARVRRKEHFQPFDQGALHVGDELHGLEVFLIRRTLNAERALIFSELEPKMPARLYASEHSIPNRILRCGGSLGSTFTQRAHLLGTLKPLASFRWFMPASLASQEAMLMQMRTLAHRPGQASMLNLLLFIRTLQSGH